MGGGIRSSSLPHSGGGGICPYPTARWGPPWGHILCGSTADSNPQPRGEAYSLTPPNGGGTIRGVRVEVLGAAYPYAKGSASSPPTHSPVGKRTPLPRWPVGKTRGISRGARAALPGRAPYTSGRSGRDPIADSGGVPLRRPAVPSAKRTRKESHRDRQSRLDATRSAPPPEAQPHMQPRRSRLLP